MVKKADQAIPNTLLKAARLERGWTQRQVADRIGAPHAVNLSRWESGTAFPSAYYVERLCQIFGKSIRELGLSQLEGQSQLDISRADPISIPENTLPLPLTSLIGREQEIVEICALLRKKTARLVTLTGTGGIGKTRLGLRVAAEVRTDFGDGVVFVSLAPLRDSTLLLPTIVTSLGLTSTDPRSSLGVLQWTLRGKHLLLVLDNFEQIVQAAPQLVELLTHCPELHILVTSRTILQVQGEYTFQVPPLALPAREQFLAPETLLQSPAVALFVERAQTANRDFHLNSANLAAITEICLRLDGLPLALELAAVRLKLLPPQVLLSRMKNPLALLTSGARDMPVRQQTLRNTIAWSYDLLSKEEQILFRRLSVFVGGCTLEAIEALYTALDGEATQVLDGVATLFEKNLLWQPEKGGEEPRLAMLETICEYGLECLTASGEMKAVQQAHAMYYLAFAETAGARVSWMQQHIPWLERLDREHGNLQAAMHFLSEQAEARGSVENALRLGVALEYFWEIRGYTSEGLRLLTKALANSQEVQATLRARALIAAANFANLQGARDQAQSLSQESLLLCRELGEAQGIARSLFQLLRLAVQRGDLISARTLAEESMTIRRVINDQTVLAFGLTQMAEVLILLGEYAEANALLEESVAIARKQGNTTALTDALLAWSRGIVLSGSEFTFARTLLEEGQRLFQELGGKDSLAEVSLLLGWVSLAQGDIPSARSWAGQALRYYQEQGSQAGVAETQGFLARAIAASGDYATARSLLEESLALSLKLELDKTEVVAFQLEGLAEVVAAQEAYSWAAQMWGSAEALRERFAIPMPPVWRISYESSVKTVRTHLGEPSFKITWVQGRGMRPEQALLAPRVGTIPTRPAL